MSDFFLKFKRRRNSIRIARALMLGAAAGLLSSGIWLILYKLDVIDFAPITALLIGAAALLLCGGLVFAFTGKRDQAFAEELDATFDLKERVQTMVAYSGEEGPMFDIQRRDADASLARIPLKSYKFKGLWIYITVLVLALAPLLAGIITADVREYTPPEQVIPFELSNLQENGINQLISGLEKSDMEEEYKTPIIEELKDLLAKLRKIKTQPQMQAAVNKSMETIRAITYESSTETEVLNALWDSDDIYFRHFAKVLDTSEWGDPNEETWGDFAENLNVYYVGVLMGDNKKDDGSGEVVVGKANLKFALDTMSRKLRTTLDEADVGAEDEICVAINKLFNGNPGGFAPLLASLDYIDEEAARNNLTLCFDFNGKNIYNALAFNKINALEGEFVMMRLGSLFGVSVPEFERPEFVKNGESVGGEGSEDEKDNNNQNSDGGIGNGATFGSDDIVIDPFTGEPTEYGKLFAKYYGIMYEKLEGDSYTEEQKEAIRKYFDLLYGSTQKEEGK